VPKKISSDDRAFLANFRDGFIVPHEYEAKLLEVIEGLTGERWRPLSTKRYARDPIGCTHSKAEPVPSYYSDTEWCPDCGAVRGTDGKFGPGSEMGPWQLPNP
jgi:hypothetical protein